MCKTIYLDKKYKKFMKKRNCACRKCSKELIERDCGLSLPQNKATTNTACIVKDKAQTANLFPCTTQSLQRTVNTYNP